MPASETASAARGNENRFESLSPASLSRTEKFSVVKLALAVLSARYRPGRAFTAPEDIEGFLRLKLTGRRNEVFGIIYLDTRHCLIKIEELFNGTVDGAAVYPRVVVQQALEKNAVAVVLFHNRGGTTRWWSLRGDRASQPNGTNCRSFPAISRTDASAWPPMT